MVLREGGTERGSTERESRGVLIQGGAERVLLKGVLREGRG